MTTHYGYAPGEKYDAIIVLGGGLAKTLGGYRSTSYRDLSDPSGMLGGRYRVLAARELYRRRASEQFVFTTGVTQRNLKLFKGFKVPTEASVYAAEFDDLTRAGYKARVLLEERSTNTYENILECLKIVRQRRWRKITIVSNSYHLERVAALVELVRRELPATVAVAYTSAEDVLRAERPGVYDFEIAQAYRSQLGSLRWDSEVEGLAKIRRGDYSRIEQMPRG